MKSLKTLILVCLAFTNIAVISVNVALKKELLTKDSNTVPISVTKEMVRMSIEYGWRSCNTGRDLKSTTNAIFYYQPNHK